MCFTRFLFAKCWENYMRCYVDGLSHALRTLAKSHADDESSPFCPDKLQIMAELTEASVKKLKVPELKTELTRRGLSAAGRKDDLIARLLEHVAKPNKVESNAGNASHPHPGHQDTHQDPAAASQETVSLSISTVHRFREVQTLTKPRRTLLRLLQAQKIHERLPLPCPEAQHQR